MVMHTYNSTLGKLRQVDLVVGQSELHIETLSKDQKQIK